MTASPTPADSPAAEPPESAAVQSAEIAWDDPTLDACESALCPCGHDTIDHAWHGCQNCKCGHSALRALLSSGVVEVRVIRPTQDRA